MPVKLIKVDLIEAEVGHPLSFEAILWNPWKWVLKRTV